MIIIAVVVGGVAYIASTFLPEMKTPDVPKAPAVEVTAVPAETKQEPAVQASTEATQPAAQPMQQAETQLAPGLSAVIEAGNK